MQNSLRSSATYYTPVAVHPGQYDLLQTAFPKAMLVKQCSKCKIVLPAADFSVDRRAKSGLQSTCKGCQAAYRADNTERSSATNKRWRDANREKDRVYHKCWYEEHTEQKRQAVRAWEARNPERRAAISQRRRARKLGAARNDLTPTQWQAALQAYENVCAYSPIFAGHTHQLHQEHVVPLVRGGDHTLENVMPVCSGCNASKGTKTALEFLLDSL